MLRRLVPASRSALRAATQGAVCLRSIAVTSPLQRPRKGPAAATSAKATPAPAVSRGRPRSRSPQKAAAAASRQAAHESNGKRVPASAGGAAARAGTVAVPPPAAPAADADSGDSALLVDADIEDFMALLHAEKEKKAAAPAGVSGYNAGVGSSSSSTTRVAAAADARVQSAAVPAQSGVAPVTGDARVASMLDEADSSVTLSPDQAAALELALAGENLFITGGAGTGKSLLLRRIVGALREAHPRPLAARTSAPTTQTGGHYYNVYVTATTGVAALNIGGMTINSFSGLNYSNPRESPETAFAKMRWCQRKAMGRWAYARTVVIDEISMMDPDLFAKLDYVARQAKRCVDKPFGGIQMILCGDFLQLPPVQKGRLTATQSRGSTTASVFERAGATMTVAQYCFQTPTWRELGMQTVVLRTMHRHGRDVAFQRVLDDVRQGDLSPHAEALLRSREVVVPSGSSSGPESSSSSRARGTAAHAEALASSEGDEHYVRLYGTNREVDRRNAQFFAALAPLTRVDNSLLPLPTGQRDAAVQQQQQPLHVYFAYDVRLAPETARERKQRLKPPKASKKGSQHSSSSSSGGGGGHREVSVTAQGMVRTVLSPRVKMLASVASSEEADALNRAWTAAYAAEAMHYKDTTLQPTVPLKLQTRVMLLTNISTRLKLVNGSVGVVTGFLHPLELVELLLLAPQEWKAARSERHAETPSKADANARKRRAEQLLARGGFDSYQDVFRCVDTSLQETLFGHLRSNHFYSTRHLQQQQQQQQSSVQYVTPENRMQFVSYGSVFGQDHLVQVMRLAGVESLAAADSPAASSGSISSSSNGGDDGDDAMLLDAILPSGAPVAVSSAQATEPPAARVQADAVFLHNLPARVLAAMRLPIVRFELDGVGAPPQPQQQQQQHTEEKKMKDNLAASPPRGNARPRHVFAFIAPTTYDSGRTSTTDVTAKHYSRTQLPLRHAWAVTVHKAQGLTLRRLELDSSCLFSPGQAYVGLSRARSLDGVRLVNFHARAVRACPIAKGYYESLAGTASPRPQKGAGWPPTQRLSEEK